ncbi:MAG: hypothetical protein ACD_28C00263G0001 [uncultured bacterium]|nr:MAG: hypothetical protein ACD_28C00263G0001 [uncultured bacterium]
MGQKKKLLSWCNQGDKVDRLEAVKEEFRKWRDPETKTKRIPEELWDAAVSVVGGEYSVNRISRILSLDFNRLKRRYLSRLPSPEKIVEISFPQGFHTPPRFPLAEVVSQSGMVLRLFSQESESIIRTFLKS